MQLLLDTHALIWVAQAPKRLPEGARRAIEDRRNTVYVSAVSALEISTKYRLGKLPLSSSLAENFMAEVEERGFTPLAISVQHAQHAGLMRIPHGDPFDRLLIAQAIVEGLTLVSNEAVFDDWHVVRLWAKPQSKD